LEKEFDNQINRQFGTDPFIRRHQEGTRNTKTEQGGLSAAFGNSHQEFAPEFHGQNRRP